MEFAPVEEVEWDEPVASEEVEWEPIKGILETPVTLVTGMAGFVGGAAKTLGDIAGQAVYSDEPIDVGAAREEGQKFAEKVTYAPRTKAGQKITETITFPFMAAIEYGGPGAQETFNQLHKLVSRTGEFKDDYVKGLGKIGEAIKSDLQGDYTKHAELVEELDLSESEQHELGKLMTELGMIAAPFLKRGIKKGKRALEKDIMRIGEEGVARTPKITREMKEIKEAVEAPVETPSVKVPVEAVKEAPKPEAPKYAGSINLEKIGVTEEARTVLIETAEKYKGQIDEARRGIITERETSKLANEMGLTVDELLKRQVGEAWNAEKALASRRILASSSERIAKLQKAARENNSDVNLVNLREALEQHNEVQAAVSGIATEAGRTLRQFRMEAGPERGYKAALDALGGRELNEAILNRLSKVDFTNPAEVNRFIREVSKATTADMVFEAWINGLLSGPATHMVNIASNTLTWLSSMPEAAAAAAIEAGRAKIKGVPRERFFGEIPYQAYGSWEGMKHGVRKGLWSFMNEMATEGASKIETRRYTSIPSKKVNVLGKEVQLGGRQARLPGRMLMAMDEFFKALNYESSKHAFVYREANKKGLKGQAKNDFIAQEINNPSLHIDKASRQEALYRVFQKELGPVGKGIQQVRGAHLSMQLIIPFLRTPINIVKYGLERTPLNYLRIMKMMGDKTLKGAALSDELARATVGSLVAMTSFMLAKEGQITGAGPESRAERDLLYRQGWQPYSIKVGDEYHHYGRLEPAGMVVGMAADVAEIWDELNEDEQQDVATLMARAIAMNLSNKTFLKGVSDVLGAMFDPERYLTSYTQRFLASGVPSVVASLERGVDPELRDAQTVIDTLKSRIPGLSKDLPARLNLWGEPIKAEGNAVARVISAAYKSKVKGNAIDKEMARLKLFPSMPSRKIGDIELTPRQYYNYARMAGQESKKRLMKEVKSSWWKRKSDDAKRATIEAIIRASRLKARADIKKKLTPKEK
jgi:phage FluMu protein gp41